MSCVLQRAKQTRPASVFADRSLAKRPLVPTKSGSVLRAAL
jgi:hypothetical protein